MSTTTQWVNPSNPLHNPADFNFEARAKEIDARKASMALAAKLGLTAMPEGKMVGDHYVAPHWSQTLAPLLQQYAAMKGTDQVAADEAALSAADKAAGLAHIQSRPQATPQQTEPFMAQDIDGDVPMGETITAPATQPSQQDMLQWAQKGMDIPSRRGVIEKVMADLEVNAPIRAEAAAIRKTEKDADRTAAAELKREQLQQQADAAKLRSDDLRLSIKQREDAAKQHDALQRQLSADRLTYQREAAADRRALIKAQIDKVSTPAAAATKTTEAERSNAGYLARMQAAEAGLADPKFKDKNGNPVGHPSLLTQAVGAVAPALKPYVEGDKQQLHTQYADDWIRAKLRKESGAAIGKDEMAAEYRTYFPMPGDSADTIKQKAQARKQAEEQLRIGAGGAYAPPAAGGASGSWDQPKPTSPGKVRVYNPATGRLE